MPKFNFGSLDKESKKVPDSQEKKLILNESTKEAKTDLARDKTPFKIDQQVAQPEVSRTVSIEADLGDKIPRTDPETWRTEKVPKSINGSKNHVEGFGHTTRTTGEIDKKIIEFDLRIEKKFNEFNERQLKLIKTGLKHELSLDNVRRYIKTHHKKTKMYKLADYFSDADLSEIEEMLMFLHSTGEIRRDKNNFWYLTKSKGE